MQSCWPCTCRREVILVCKSGARRQSKSISTAVWNAAQAQAQDHELNMMQKSRFGGARAHRVMSKGASAAFAAGSSQEKRAVCEAPSVHGLTCAVGLQATPTVNGAAPNIAHFLKRRAELLCAELQNVPSGKLYRANRVAVCRETRQGPFNMRARSPCRRRHLAGLQTKSV